MDDEVTGGWTLDPETKARLRLDRVRKALEDADPREAMVEVEELLDEDPHHPGALFLLAEALLDLGEGPEAAIAYQRHLEYAGADAPTATSALVGLEIARFESSDFVGAIEAGREVVRRAPDVGEAHYYLGLALERVPGRKGEALQALMAAHHLDPDAYPLPLQLDKREWERICNKALAEIPERLRELWRGVPVKLQDVPPVELLTSTDPPITPLVAGLYEGEAPDPELAWDQKPEAFVVYTGNLARLGDADAAVDELAKALEAEAADWLGGNV